MDGLLVDSEPVARQAWEKVVQQYGRILDDETHSRIVGLRLEETSVLLQARLDIPADPTELARKKEAYLAQLSMEGVPPMPGLDELMAELQLRQVPWGVATSNRRAFVTQVLQQLGLWSTCQSLTTGQDVQRGKPAPDIYLLAAERMAIAPEFCLALEDSVPGHYRHTWPARNRRSFRLRRLRLQFPRRCGWGYGHVVGRQPAIELSQEMASLYGVGVPIVANLLSNHALAFK